MERIYASIPTSHSWGGFKQNTPQVTHGEVSVLCKADLHNLPRKCVHIYSIYHGEFLCKRELLKGNPVINHVLRKTSPCIYLTIVLSWEGFMQK